MYPFVDGPAQTTHTAQTAPTRPAVILSHERYTDPYDAVPHHVGIRYTPLPSTGRHNAEIVFLVRDVDLPLFTPHYLERAQTAFAEHPGLALLVRSPSPLVYAESRVFVPIH
eukprot:1196421-Prorocentrum_minimum.AAC.2